MTDFYTGYWEPWFAWRPVKTIEGDWVFLCIIKRRFNFDRSDDYTEIQYDHIKYGSL